MSPHVRHCVYSLPPEGVHLAWGGPAEDWVSPHVRHCVYSLPPEGVHLPWGGPAGGNA